MYARRSRRSPCKQMDLLRMFVAGATAKATSEIVLKRVGKVFTAIVPNARRETLLPIIEEKVTPDSIVHTDSFKAYNALDVSDFHHMRINHSELFAD